MWSILLSLIASSTALQIPLRQALQTPLQDQAPGDRYLIELSPEETRWVTEDEKWALRRDGRRFMDITDDIANPSVFTQQTQSVVNFPNVPKHNDTISPLLEKLDKDQMHKNLEHFSSFHTRYYKSDYGKESQAWLFDQVQGLLKDSGAAKHGASVESFPHPWGQNSIIVTIPGKSEATVVVGAHQDSINLFLPSLLAAPGADDDGSGTVTILEALRVLLKSDEIVRGNASNTIEFHWYSAEEGGLLGSQAVFKKYQQQGRKIKAMLQQDMTGYTQGTLAAGKTESVGIITDFVDSGLTNFMKDIVTTYCDIPYVETKCGYACSDHASARKAGYPSAFVIESDFEHSNHNIHTTRDTIDRLDFNHMLQHARLTLAAVFELAFADF